MKSTVADKTRTAHTDVTGEQKLRENFTLSEKNNNNMMAFSQPRNSLCFSVWLLERWRRLCVPAVLISSPVICFCATSLNRLSVYHASALVFLTKSSRGKNVWVCVKNTVNWATHSQRHSSAGASYIATLSLRAYPLTFEQNWQRRRLLSIFFYSNYRLTKKYLMIYLYNTIQKF